MFKIEKNVPMPRSVRRGKESIYPFSDMEVMDSFSFSEAHHRKVTQAAHYHGKAHGKKFSISLNELRCWRVK